ncbi:hypothetical protein LSAT2_006243 [Lamellibrachia satsuma]|nr:hypothetical protein LSAT2_006243 [Lamellibrachia satsuma]
MSTIQLCFVAAYGLNECSDEKIRECLNMVGNVKEGTDILTESDAEQMQSVCRKYNQFERCLDSLESECGQEQLLGLQNVASGLKFVCESLDDYLKHAACFTKMNMVETEKTCSATFKSNSQAAKGSKTRLCQNMDDLVNCLVKPVSSNCGEDAARYLRRMLVHFAKPSLDLIDCDISAATSRVVNSVMVTVLAVMVLPVLTLLGV